MYRVAAPTACKKNREFEKGFLIWHPPSEPTLEILPSSLYDNDEKGKRKSLNALI